MTRIALRRSIGVFDAAIGSEDSYLEKIDAYMVEFKANPSLGTIACLPAKYLGSVSETNSYGDEIIYEDIAVLVDERRWWTAIRQLGRLLKALYPSIEDGDTEDVQILDLSYPNPSVLGNYRGLASQHFVPWGLSPTVQGETYGTVPDPQAALRSSIYEGPYLSIDYIRNNAQAPTDPFTKWPFLPGLSLQEAYTRNVIPDDHFRSLTGPFEFTRQPIMDLPLTYSQLVGADAAKDLIMAVKDLGAGLLNAVSAFLPVSSVLDKVDPIVAGVQFVAELRMHVPIVPVPLPQDKPSGLGTVDANVAAIEALTFQITELKSILAKATTV